MQASLNQMNSCSDGTKLSGLFLQQIWRHTPSRKQKYDPEIRRNEECAGNPHGKNQTSANVYVDLRALTDSWWDWNSRMAARLNLWTKTFKIMD